jgi:two-component system sensor histidine kinase/response regulator
MQSNNNVARLLIVDDEEAQMTALCNTLKAQGYETQGFTSAVVALSALAQQPCDLLLTDLMMPEMDGITLLRSALSIDPQLVGIIMTGEGTIASAVQAMQSGALDYILKPFKLSAILPVLARALAMRNLRLENAALERRVRERTAELEAANRDLEAYAYSVSHDLRAPLRGIDGLTKLLRQLLPEPLPEQTRRVLGHIDGSVERARHLIDDLLRLSRVGQQPIERRVVDVVPLVRGVLGDLRLEQSARNVRVDVAGSLPPALADAELLRQVFSNLLSNAYKFSRKRPRALIEVGCEARDHEHVYFVRDNGAGFDTAHAERLFVPFERLHRAEEYEGTGVGLSIVQRIVQRHGGQIWAEGAVDQGACFHFTLGTASAAQARGLPPAGARPH